MKALDAAEVILKEAGRPLRAEELTALILERGLWATEGRTPAATIHASLAVDVKKNGAASRFVRSAPGTFGLRAWRVQEFTADTAGTMSFTDAAEAVLEEADPPEPINYRELTERAIARGYLRTSGLTPDQTMYVQLRGEIERRERRGDAQRFTRQPKGMFGLARWQAGDLQFEIAQHNRKVKDGLRASLHDMDPKAFESLVGQLLTKLGFEDVEVTSYHGDGGIDVRGILVVGDVIRTHMVVQAKRWKSNVQAPTVQQVRGALGAHDQGLIITTSDFSEGARREAAIADRTPVALMDGDQLVALLVEHEIRVRRETHELLYEFRPELADDSE